MRLRPLTSRRFVALAVLTGFTGAAHAQMTTKPANPVRPPHCKFLDQLTPEQRQAHLNWPHQMLTREADGSAAVTRATHTFDVYDTIPQQLNDAIDDAFLKANPGWKTETRRQLDRLDPTILSTDPRYLDHTRPFFEFLNKRHHEAHRQCEPPGLS